MTADMDLGVRPQVALQLSAQMEFIEKIHAASRGQFDSVISSLHQFTTSYKDVREGVHHMSDDAKRQKRISGNLETVKQMLSNLLGLLDADVTYKMSLAVPIEEEFDVFIAGMITIIAAKKEIRKWTFPDALKARTSLEALQRQGNSVISDYFESLIVKVKNPLSPELFTMRQQEFYVTDANLRENICYPINDSQLNKLNQMALILNDQDSSKQMDVYIKERVESVETTLKPLAKATLNAKTDPAPLNVTIIPLYIPRSHPFHVFAYTFKFLYSRESKLASIIFSKTGKDTEVLSRLFTPIVKLFTDTLNSYREYISAQNDILAYLDIVTTLQDLILRIDDSVSNVAVNILEQCRLYRDIVQKALDNYSSSILNHEIHTVPSDGNVSPIVSNVLLFLNMICEYEGAIDQNPQLPTKKFINTCVSALLENVQSKGKYNGDKAFECIFVMNSCDFAERFIQSSRLSVFVSHSNMKRIEDLIQSSQDTYIALTWDKCTAKLKEDAITSGFKKGQTMNYQQRKSIKYKFKQFSDKIDDIMHKHNKYCLNNTRMTSVLYNGASHRIQAVYEPFWLKWKDSGFSKTPEKWIYYQPNTLQQMIARLYKQKKG